jgi:hypothetical protein
MPEILEAQKSALLGGAATLSEPPNKSAPAPTLTEIAATKKTDKRRAARSRRRRQPRRQHRPRAARVSADGGEDGPETEERAHSGLLDGYVREDSVCVQLGVTAVTLRRWRRIGEGPPFVRAPGGIFYPEQEFRDWMKARVCRGVRSVGA